MKLPSEPRTPSARRAGCTTARVASLLLLAWSLVRVDMASAASGQDFPAPEAAASALVEAARNYDREALRRIFGLRADEVVAADQVQATNELAEFTAAYGSEHRLVRGAEDRYILEVGAERWPFPIPIVRAAGAWRFDTDAGIEELLNRRIGRNELSVLQVMRAFVDAQREYASRDRDGDQVREFAQRFRSTPGTKDGLYWPEDLDGEISPLGPLAAQAYLEGYRRRSADEAVPFHGYYFKILTRQGKQAPGGKHDYLINGNMIAGFAVVAWPAQYGESGVMTFIVNQQGLVYEKDLGARTGRIAASMTTYDLDSTWTVCAD